MAALTEETGRDGGATADDEARQSQHAPSYNLDRAARPGVLEAQIETAAAHRGEGTNERDYRHLQNDYLKEFVARMEDL